MADRLLSPYRARRKCRDCRYLADCARDTGARLDDPICTAFAPAATVPPTPLPGKQEIE